MPNCTHCTLATSAGEYGNLASISPPRQRRRRLGFGFQIGPPPGAHRERASRRPELRPYGRSLSGGALNFLAAKIDLERDRSERLLREQGRGKGIRERVRLRKGGRGRG
jgi:hypothetical protein